MVKALQKQTSYGPNGSAMTMKLRDVAQQRNLCNAWSLVELNGVPTMVMKALSAIRALVPQTWMLATLEMILAKTNRTTRN